jgi:hypothetical protein
MQEEVDSRTVALVINSAKLTGRVFKTAIDKYITYCKSKKLQKHTVIPHGKQSVKQLIGQNQGVTTFESNDIDVKGFERYARKYGVDYAIKLTQILQRNTIQNVTILRMSVPCCGGLTYAVQRAIEASGKRIPVQVITVRPDGTIAD